MTDQPEFELGLPPRMFSGDRMRLARHIAGLSRQDLAVAIGVSLRTVTDWENDKRTPSRRHVPRLCRALSVRSEFFTPAPPKGSVVAPFFRSLSEPLTQDENWAGGYSRAVADVADYFDELAGLPPADVPALPVLWDERDGVEPEDRALQTRREWGISDGPIPNVVQLLEQKGVICSFAKPHRREISGFSTYVGGRPIVVFNPTSWDRYRHRFDSAHELAHLVMHRDTPQRGSAIERQADRFASEFLMPARLIARHLPAVTTRGGWRLLQELKERWGVSLHALLYRSRALGVMSDVTYRNALARLAADGHRLKEPGRYAGTLEMASSLADAAARLGDQGTAPSDIAARLGINDELLLTIISRLPMKPELPG